MKKIEVLKIKKRDGTVTEYTSVKIRNAIYKANLEAIHETFDADVLNNITQQVENAIMEYDVPTVEQIQDTVEKVLMANNYPETAKSFIIYRNEHANLRGGKSRLKQMFDELTFTDAANADIKRENANIDADTAMGTMLKYGSEGSKFYIDQCILPKDIAKAHAEGKIHIHKLYCGFAG